MVLLPRSHIGVMELFGLIGSGSRMAGYIRLLEAARESRRVKAVVLDIDSPGGLATTSQHLHFVIGKLAKRKPVVAFVRGSATSGAYLAGCAASKVVALPAAIVGSIGVISLRPLIPQLLDRLGIKIQVTKGGRLKDMGAVWREPTEEEKQKEEALVTELYDWFVAMVAKARKLEKDKVLQIATGEVFTAATAKDLGLVDELGDLEVAIHIAAEAAKVAPRTFLLRPRRPLIERLLAPSASGLAESLVLEMEGLLGSRIYFSS